MEEELYITVQGYKTQPSILYKEHICGVCMLYPIFIVLHGNEDVLLEKYFDYILL